MNNNKKNIEKEIIETKEKQIEKKDLNKNHTSIKSNSFSQELLKKQFNDINLSRSDLGFNVSLIDEDNIYKWSFLLIGPEDTFFEGGFFKWILTFSEDYPNNPPEMKMISEMFHPNIEKDGLVNMSILHRPGYDMLNEQEPIE